MHTLPILPYDYAALEPVIDEATMKIHHTKHHQAYIDKLNTILEGQVELSAQPAAELLKSLASLPASVRDAVRNHGGGHVNHSLFWQMLAPAGSEGTVMPIDLKLELERAFGRVDEFKNKFAAAGLGRFGSGWAWLVRDPSNQLQIISTANQDSPLSQGLTPVLGVDVWEHAYYLKYQNKRGDYLSAIWQVINWQKVASLANI